MARVSKSVFFVLDLAKKLLSPDELTHFLNLRCSFGTTAIQYSCYYGTYLVFKTILDFGADLTIVNFAGLSCLHSAAQGDNINIFFHLLVVNQVDIFQCDLKESTVLHWSAFNGSTRMVDFLLQLEFPTELKDKEGNTALHLALYSSKSIKRGTDHSEETILLWCEPARGKPRRQFSLGNSQKRQIKGLC